MKISDRLLSASAFAALVAANAVPVRADTTLADNLARMEARLEALESAFRSGIFLTPQDCAVLGTGWEPLAAAAGRLLLAANPSGDGGNPDLTERILGDTGGAESVVLERRHTPQHVHVVSIEPHTHRVDMRARSLNLQRAGTGGRTVSLRALERGGSTQTGRAEPDIAASTESLPVPDSLEAMPPFLVVNACHFTEPR